MYQRALDDVNPDSAVLRECLKQVKQKIKKADEEARVRGPLRMLQSLGWMVSG